MSVLENKTLLEMINAEDVHPWYRARLQVVKNWAHGLPRNSIGVDIGCGSGAAAQLIKSTYGLEVIGYDISPDAVIASKALQADVTKLPIKDSSQDFALALDVVEHIEDRSVLLREMLRILKPGGRCLITVPAHMWLWSIHDEHNHHFRRYSKSLIKTDLQEVGFEIVSIRWWNSIFLPYIYLTRILYRNQEQSEFQLPPRPLSLLVEKVLILESKSRLLGKLVGVSLVVDVVKPSS
jgi:ubiquinone/menaquinone biosynthesis C-methylase UbiE